MTAVSQLKSPLVGRSLAAILLLLVLALVSTTTTAAEILDLSADSFTELVTDTLENHDKNKVVLVDFYAPWCSQCKKLNPVLKEFATKLTPAVNEIVVVKIDVAAYKDIASQYEITRFPTMKFLYQSKWTDYEGNRDLVSFEAFAERMRNPAFVMVTSSDQVKEVVRTHDVVFVYCTGAKDKNSKEGPTYKNTFIATVESLKHKATFVSADINDLSDIFEVKNSKNIRAASATATATATAAPPPPFFAKLEANEPPIFYDGPLDKEVLLTHWVEDNNIALLSKIQSHNFRRLSEGKLLVTALYNPSLFGDAAEEHLWRALHTVKQAARDLPQVIRDQCTFGWMDTSEWASFIENFGVYSTDPLPQFVIMDESNNVFYTRPDLHDTSGLGSFVTDVIEGKVPPQKDRFMVDLPRRLYHRFVYFWPWSCLVVVPLILVVWAFVTPEENPEMTAVTDDSSDEALKGTAGHASEAGKGDGGGKSKGIQGKGKRKKND